jgi:hypothetical protein
MDGQLPATILRHTTQMASIHLPKNSRAWPWTKATYSEEKAETGSCKPQLQLPLLLSTVHVSSHCINSHFAESSYLHRERAPACQLCSFHCILSVAGKHSMEVWLGRPEEDSEQRSFMSARQAACTAQNAAMRRTSCDV